MKIAFVLSGGGAKGAYEIGFIKAMLELNIFPDIITGTSIGALNGCLFAQQDYQIAIDLWEHITIDQIIKDGFNLDDSIDSLILQSNLVLSFFKSYLNSKGANITPLIELTHQLCNEEKLRNSPIDFGLVCIEYPTLTPIEISKNEIPNGQIADYLIASASCFPAFPIHHFNNKGYIDGGYYDNLPIDLALKLGADQIIAVELTPHQFTHQHYINRPNIKYISPLNNLGNFMDFSRETIHKRITFGYNDTMKAFSKYEGFSYTFYQIPSLYLFDEFYKMILSYEATINKQFIKRKSKIYNPIPLTQALIERTNLQQLQPKHYSILALEICANMYNYDMETIYHFDQLNQDILIHFQENIHSCHIKSDYSIQNMTHLLTNISKKDMLCYIYTKIANESIFNYTWLINNFPTECVGAMYLYTLTKFY